MASWDTCSLVTAYHSQLGVLHLLAELSRQPIHLQLGLGVFSINSEEVITVLFCCFEPVRRASIAGILASTFLSYI